MAVRQGPRAHSEGGVNMRRILRRVEGKRGRHKRRDAASTFDQTEQEGTEGTEEFEQ